jgi:glutamine amidotransferase
VLIASEPFDDDPEWTDVPDRCLVQVMGERITITELRG